MQEIKIGKYRHFKGAVVEIIALAKHSETLEELVIYKHDENIWARPVSMFLSNEDISNRADNITGQNKRFIKEEKKRRVFQRCFLLIPLHDLNIMKSES